MIDRLPKGHPCHLSPCPQVHCLTTYPETTPVCQSTSAPACSMACSMAPGRSQGQPAKAGEFRGQEVLLAWNLGGGCRLPWASQPTGNCPNAHLQPVYHGPLDVHKAAMSWPLLPRRWLLCHHIRRQTLPLPWHLHLHSSPGRRSPRAGGKGTIQQCLTYDLLTSAEPTAS